MKPFELVPFGGLTYIVRFLSLEQNREDILWLHRWATVLREQDKGHFETVLVSHLDVNLVLKKPMNQAELENIIENALEQFAHQAPEGPKVLWEIPACFEPDFAPDLYDYFDGDYDKAASYIKDFTDQSLFVYFFGFLPGFAYLGGLPPELQIRRKDHPRLEVPKGALGVGGSYVAVYPQKSPGGWQLIGQTPFIFFDIRRKSPFFLQPGELVRFMAIDVKEYGTLVEAYEAAPFLPKKIEM